MKALVYDEVTSIIMVIGSAQTSKSQFVKKTLLPFIANELFSTIHEKDEQLSSLASNRGGFLYKAQVSLSSFEIQDEIVTDLLRPANRGMGVHVTTEEGMQIQSIHREVVSDESDLRGLLFDVCENRGSHALPVGGSIDTSSAVYEFNLFQSEVTNKETSLRDSHSRLLVVEVPAVDPLSTVAEPSIAAILNSGPLDSMDPSVPSSLHRPLFVFADVIKKLSDSNRAAIAPFRSSKLTHFLSEVYTYGFIIHHTHTHTHHIYIYIYISLTSHT